MRHAAGTIKNRWPKSASSLANSNLKTLTLIIAFSWRVWIRHVIEQPTVGVVATMTIMGQHFLSETLFTLLIYCIMLCKVFLRPGDWHNLKEPNQNGSNLDLKRINDARQNCYCRWMQFYNWIKQIHIPFVSGWWFPSFRPDPQPLTINPFYPIFLLVVSTLQCVMIKFVVKLLNVHVRFSIIFWSVLLIDQLLKKENMLNASKFP